MIAFRSPRLGLVWQGARATIAGGQLLTLIVNTPDMVQALPPAEISCQSADALLLHCISGGGEFTWIAQLAIVVILCGVVSGYFPRISGPLHVYAALNIQAVLSTKDGGDQAALVLAVLMLPLCLSDPRRQSWSGEYLPGDWGWISLLVIRLQVAWIYAEAAVAKLGEQTWIAGTAVSYWTRGIYFRPMQSVEELVPSLASTPVVTLLATYGTIVFEIALAVSLLMRPLVRYRLFPLAVTFHVLIGVTFGIWSFALVMSGAAMLLLLVPVADRSSSIGSATTMEASRGRHCGSRDYEELLQVIAGVRRSSRSEG